MGLGQTAVKYRGSAGEVLMSDVQNWNCLYETSTIKPAGYNIGDRIALPDTRAFRLALAGKAIADKNHGAKYWSGLLGNGITYVAPDQGQEIGDVSIHTTASGITKDVLRGGYVIVHTHTAHDDQFRGILGNTATDGDGDITIYLDAPLKIKLLTSHGLEIHANPYSDVRVRSADNGVAGDHYSSVAGMPNVLTAEDNQYLWIQTWGPCWVNPKPAPSAQTGRRGLWFDYEGSVVYLNTNVVTYSLQYAGFIMDREDASDICSPLTYLQISP